MLYACTCTFAVGGTPRSGWCTPTAAIRDWHRTRCTRTSKTERRTGTLPPSAPRLPCEAIRRTELLFRTDDLSGTPLRREMGHLGRKLVPSSARPPLRGSYKPTLTLIRSTSRSTSLRYLSPLFPALPSPLPPSEPPTPPCCQSSSARRMLPDLGVRRPLIGRRSAARERSLAD